MGSSEKFCLRWNDFESNISVAFREIREEKDFFDCTLSCGSRQIQAHKLILSACSPFFRSVLRQNPHQHPLLYLKGVEFTDLQAVLNFMYHGEVNVAQEELNSFLAVAEDLKVKGLTQNNTEHSTTPQTKPEPISAPTPRLRPTNNEEQSTKRPRYPATSATTSEAETFQDDDIQEVMPVVKQEPSSLVGELLTPSQPLATMSQTAYQPTITTHTTSHQENTVAQMEESYGDDGYDYEEYEGEDGYEGDVMMDNTGAGGGGGDHSKDIGALVETIHSPSGHPTLEQFRCSSCLKVFSDKSNCRRHIKCTHIVSPQVTCNYCGKMFKNKRYARVHYGRCTGTQDIFGQM